jgi:hypothetical protein
MPVLTGAACLTSDSCPEVIFPTTLSLCKPTLAAGGVNDLYFIPCSQVMSAVNIADLDWWSLLINGDSEAEPEVLPKLGRLGIGLGSIGKKSDKKERIGSCRVEETTSLTWALKYQIKSFDKTSADTTTLQMNSLLTESGSYLVIARMCDGPDTILPIGEFTTSDFNWTVPDNFEEVQVIELELSWQELGMPKRYSIAGLSAVLPKVA